MKANYRYEKEHNIETIMQKFMNVELHAWNRDYIAYNKREKIKLKFKLRIRKYFK